jgi:hypothetical protein
MNLANDFIDYTITSVTSAAAVHVSANVKLFKETERTWRSTSLAAQTWVIDCLILRTAPLPILIYYANCPSIRIKANTTNSFAGAVPFDSGALTMVKDPEHQIYKHIEYITTNFRYIQIVISSQTPTDGASYYEIGSIIVPSAYAALILSKEQFEFPVSKEIAIYEKDIEGEVGIIDSVLLGKIPELSFSLGGKMGIDFGTRDKLASILGIPGKGYVLLDFSHTGLSARNTYETYMTKRNVTYSANWDRRISTQTYGFRTV